VRIDIIANKLSRRVLTSCPIPGRVKEEEQKDFVSMMVYIIRISCSYNTHYTSDTQTNKHSKKTNNK